MALTYVMPWIRMSRETVAAYYEEDLYVLRPFAVWRSMAPRASCAQLACLSPRCARSAARIAHWSACVCIPYSAFALISPRPAGLESWALARAAALHTPRARCLKNEEYWQGIFGALGNYFIIKLYTFTYVRERFLQMFVLWTSVGLKC